MLAIDKNLLKRVGPKPQSQTASALKHARLANRDQLHFRLAAWAPPSRDFHFVSSRRSRSATGAVPAAEIHHRETRRTGYGCELGTAVLALRGISRSRSATHGTVDCLGLHRSHSSSRCVSGFRNLPGVFAAVEVGQNAARLRFRAGPLLLIAALQKVQIPPTAVGGWFRSPLL